MNSKTKIKPHFTESMPIGRGLRYIIEAILVHIVYGFFWLLPANTASNIGGWIGRKFGLKLAGSKIAYDNLSQAFPEMNEQEKQKIVLGMWDNLGRTIAEYPHLRKIAQAVEIVNKDMLEDIIKGDKAAMMVSGHFANWEIMPASAKQQCNLDMTLAYREPNNPWIEKLLQYARKSGANDYIFKSRKSIIKMTSVIKNGGKLGILIDQKFNEGLPIPFFGRDAMTMPVAAQFALKFNCPIYLIRMERLGGAKFRMTVLPKLEVETTGNKEQDIYKIMLDIHQIMEGWIKERPEQWLWLHRRWPKL